MGTLAVQSEKLSNEQFMDQVAALCNGLSLNLEKILELDSKLTKLNDLQSLSTTLIFQIDNFGRHKEFDITILSEAVIKANKVFGDLEGDVIDYTSLNFGNIRHSFSNGQGLDPNTETKNSSILSALMDFESGKGEWELKELIINRYQ